jgi:hypothetical protein
VKRFAVQLDLRTPGKSIPGFMKAYGSVFRRLPRRKGKREVVWRLDSGLNDRTSIEKQVTALQRRFPFHVLANTRTEVKSCLGIGVFYDTFTCSVQLPLRVMDLAREAGMHIEVTCYPTQGENAKKR